MTSKRNLLKLKVGTRLNILLPHLTSGMIIQGLSEAKVDKIKVPYLLHVNLPAELLTKEAVHKLLGSPFQTGVQVSESRRRVFSLSTGSKSVDAMLGGMLNHVESCVAS